ncbi:regulatory protein RecX [Sedimentibacter sp. MB31-C6]|uniref:regulatory protein RecX n=1 Tax=Sedimentibacter sp. MB31-C6 TaxID=3109366 RepID=UPI002DDC9639|nr:RecX family transcriptional regulator [Sedimentibacter sp. MB36-C1]WSI02889.1 RecX family transcriptional regulator [Sedimentibacter sp. MB36-C1]
MKKITKIEYQKNNKDRVNIYLNDEFGFGLDLNIMIKYSLSKNMELDDEFISEILIAEDKNKAYNYAISILSRRAKSEKELRLKMSQKGYENEYIDFTIDKLKQNKYIDDSDYSERFILDKLNFSKYGKLKIREALYNKGIDKQIIDEKLILISSEDEFKRSYELAEKKLKSLSKLDSQKKRIKLYNFLINKGFEYDTVKKVVSELLKEEYNGFDD